MGLTLPPHLGKFAVANSAKQGEETEAAVHLGGFFSEEMSACIWLFFPCFIGIPHLLSSSEELVRK